MNDKQFRRKMWWTKIWGMYLSKSVVIIAFIFWILVMILLSR